MRNINWLLVNSGVAEISRQLPAALRDGSTEVQPTRRQREVNARNVSRALVAIVAYRERWYSIANLKLRLFP